MTGMVQIVQKTVVFCAWRLGQGCWPVVSQRRGQVQLSPLTAGGASGSFIDKVFEV